MKTWDQSDRSDGVRYAKTLAGSRFSISSRAEISYHVDHVSERVFAPESTALAELLESRPTIFVIDRVVDHIYGEQLAAYTDRYLDCVGVLEIDGAENAKSLDQVEEICAYAIRAGLRRDGVIAAVGGGVTLDIAGLAASLYRRGVRYARIPTTLVAMVDAGVGIKQGVNFAGRKNIIGAFYPPIGVIVDLGFLETLPQRQMACGVAEIVKMAILRDPLLFELVESHVESLLASGFRSPPGVADEIVQRSAIAMLSELQPNLYERDLKRLVDFGHSFSPWLECASRHELLHGEAVAIDMLICIAVAVRRGICDPAVFGRAGRALAAAGLPLSHGLCEAEQLVAALDDARIHRGGNLNLVLPTGIGSATFIQDVSLDEVSAALSEVDLLARHCVAQRVGVHALAGV